MLLRFNFLFEFFGLPSCILYVKLSMTLFIRSVAQNTLVCDKTQQHYLVVEFQYNFQSNYAAINQKRNFHV